MKSIFSKTLVILLACICAFSLISCVNGAKGINGDEAKAFISDFFAEIVAENYVEAESYLHPERPADLETFLLGIEEEESIDFQAGIEIEKYTGFKSSFYDSSVGGSTYELTIRTKVGDEKVSFTIEIVNNENGYGIYNLDIDT